MRTTHVPTPTYRFTRANMPTKAPTTNSRKLNRCKEECRNVREDDERKNRNPRKGSQEKEYRRHFTTKDRLPNSAKKFPRFCLQPPRDLDDIYQADVSQAAFDPADVGSVEVTPLGQCFLRQVKFVPQSADTSSKEGGDIGHSAYDLAGR
jgi:hypothetical protein